MKLKERLEVPVSWKDLLFLLGSFAVFNMALQAHGLAKAETIADKGVALAQGSVIQLQRKVEQNKSEADAGMQSLQREVQEVRKDNQAIYNFLLTKKRQARMEETP